MARAAGLAGGCWLFKPRCGAHGRPGWWSDKDCIGWHKRGSLRGVNLSRHARIWIGLVVACVVIWLVADSQGNQILDLNATGAFLTLLKVLWTLSLLGFIVLVLFGLFTVVRARLRRSRASQP